MRSWQREGVKPMGQRGKGQKLDLLNRKRNDVMEKQTLNHRKDRF
jgi:hypothetical protein